MNIDFVTKHLALAVQKLSHDLLTNGFSVPPCFLCYRGEGMFGSALIKNQETLFIGILSISFLFPHQALLNTSEKLLILAVLRGKTTVGSQQRAALEKPKSDTLFDQK